MDWNSRKICSDLNFTFWYPLSIYLSIKIKDNNLNSNEMINFNGINMNIGSRFNNSNHHNNFNNISQNNSYENNFRRSTYSNKSENISIGNNIIAAIK